MGLFVGCIGVGVAVHFDTMRRGRGASSFTSDDWCTDQQLKRWEL